MINYSLSLKNVLFVPSFTYNLLSISKLLQDSHSQVIFLADKCYLTYKTSQKQIELGSEEHGLYMMTYTPHSSNVLTKSHNPVTSDSVKPVDSDKFVAQVHTSDVWHARMGHISAKILNSLPIDVSKKVLDVCDSFYFAKQSRLQFFYFYAYQ